MKPNKKIISLLFCLSVIQYLDTYCINQEAQKNDTFYVQQAHLLIKNNKFTSALEYCKKALTFNPKNINAICLMGYVLHEQGNIDAAIEQYLKAIELNKNNPNICKNAALLFREKEMPEEALHLYQQALSINPKDSVTQCCLGETYLTLGDFKNGFFYMNKGRQDHYTFEKPLTSISEIPGNRIFIPKNWGLGDMIQFIRFAKLIQDKGGTVIVQCQKTLEPILSLCPHIDQVTTERPSSQAYDKQIPIWRLPQLFNTTLDTIPNTPYLHAHPALTYKWRKKIKDTKGLKIGLCWQGSGLLHYKDIALEKFALLANIPGVSLYSLQKGKGCSQLKNVPFIVHDFGEEFDTTNGPFMDTAAIMKHMDLIITVDTSLAHLAGALGVPVWVLIPFAPDWRWMIGKGDTPWYPTMKLFRGTKRYEWEPVIEKMKKELEKIII